jgi:hypothetical protein
MKSRKIFLFFICISACIVSFAGVSSAQAPAPPAGEEMLFTTSTAPDALILIDLSGSMEWNPAGGTDRYGDSSCIGPFFPASGAGHTTDCRRIEIAKRTIFAVFDDNNDGVIDSSDEGSLGVRIGFMRFRGGDDTAGSWSSGNSRVLCPIGSAYSRIFCANGTSCASTVSSCSNKGCQLSGGTECVVGESANGGTPLSMSLHEAKVYLDAHKATDTYAECRQKFVILISDGADTYACGGDGQECKNVADAAGYSSRFKGRREVVAQAKALADAGYKVFVIGFGSSMSTHLQNTLNWAAYYGGTDDPNAANSGITTGYNIPAGCNSTTNPSACCNTGNLTACYPSGVGTGCVGGYGPLCCKDETLASMVSGTCLSTNYSYFFAPTNDPGNTALSGYAFLAANADTLTASLKTAMNLIHQATFSFTQASVQASRTVDENFLYEASFDPINNEPFWHGHLKKYQINADGTIGNMLGDGADVLRSSSAAGRHMYTLISGTRTAFTNSIDPSYFGYLSTNTAERDKVVYYIRGESAYNPDSLAGNVYKLGDIFRSSPITVGTPSVYYDDNRDVNYVYTCGGSPANINAFAKHRCDHPRSSANGYRIIVAGANDGQLHAFKTADMSEAWSFIPPNLLSKLNQISHIAHPANLTHTYFVDGPVMVVDVWWGAGDGTSKNDTDWHTVLVLAEGRGNSPNLWSSSSTCDSGFSPVYSASYPYYCGYYALDVTNTLNPQYLWHLGGTTAINAAQAPYLGDPWSKMMPGKVLIGGKERWVGFIGGGYNATDCQKFTCGVNCDCRGKGFFIVDIKDGIIIKSFTLADDARMKYGLPATATILDADNDGFIDTAYIGDLGGNIWRFKLCTKADGLGCNDGSWQQTLFFDSSSGVIRPIYTMPAAAIDKMGNLWIYWGSGDKNDPTAPNAQEKFYAVKDNDRTTTYNINDLDNITAAGQTYDNTDPLAKAGYYIDITGGGEKILADPVVFGGVVYFTTYEPPVNKPCEQTGVASLYGVKYTSGGGVFPGGRSMTIGQGIASSPVVSTGQGASTSDIYVTTSSGGVGRVPFNPPGGGRRTQMLYWRDQRLQ